MESHILTIILYVLLFLIEWGMFATNYDNIQRHGYINIFIINTFLAIICLNLLIIFLVNILKRKRKFQWTFYITSLNYVAFNTSIGAFQFMLISDVTRFQYYHISVEIFLIQLILLPIWQILLTFIYLEQNEKLNSLLIQYGIFGLILTIMRTILTIFCLMITYEFKRYQFINDIELLINANTLIYLIVIQLQAIFISFGYDKKQYKTLDYVILFYQVQYICFSFSIHEYQFNETLWLELLIFLLLIEFKRYPIVQQEILQQDFQQVLFCYFCKEHVTKNQLIIYFQDSQNIFHNQCYNNYKLQALSIDDYHFSIDFQSDSNNNIQIKDLIIFISSFSTYFLLNLIIILNNGNTLVNIFYKSSVLCQFILIILIIILDFAKKLKVLFLAKLKYYFIAILYICLYSNYFILHEIIQETLCQKTDNDYQYYYECEFQEQILIIFEVVIYYLYLNCQQGFLFSKLFQIPQRTLINQQNLIIFHSFFLISIQNIVYQIIWFNKLWLSEISEFYHLDLYVNIVNTTIILSNFTNLFLSIYIILTQKQQSIQGLSNKTKIVNKIIQFYMLFQIFVIICLFFLNFFQNSYFFNQDWLIRRIFLLFQFFNAYYALYIKWFWFQINDTFYQNELIRITNYDELIIPDMRQIQTSMCKSCKRQIKKGQTIIYKIKCKHSIHKECYISWLNYPWCCQNKDNQVIEIIWN